MPSVFQSYYAGLPPKRRERLQEIEARILAVVPEAKRSLRYKMPTFETPRGWVAIGNQKHHVSVYTCSEPMIERYVKRHPAIDHGKGCLRFRDSVTIDFAALDLVFGAALLGE